MAVLNNSALVGASGKGGTGAITTPQRSLRFNSARSAFLSRTFASAGNRKTWTWSGWVKRSALSADGHLFTAYVAANDNQIIEFRFSNDKLVFARWTGVLRTTTQVFRDTGAWAHVVLTVDTTQATANDRIKLYWNGTQITQFDAINNPGPSDDLGVNQAGLHTIGREWTGTTTFNGYLANIHFIDGQALDASAFAYTDPATGRWEPKAYAGSYSGNSFYLDFSDNSAATATTLGADRSGLGNNWVPNNFNATAAPYFYPPSGGGGLDQYIPAGWTRTNNPSDVLVNNQTGVLVNQSGALMFAIKPTSSSITIKWIVYDGSGVYTPNVVLNTSSSWSNTSITPSSVSGNGSTGSPSVGTYSVTAGTTYYVSTYGQGNPALVVYATNVTIEPIGTSASGIDSLRDHPVSAGIDGGLGGQVSGNYCTLNPLSKSGNISLANGNLDYTTSTNGHQLALSTFRLDTGKWYWEQTMNTAFTNAVPVGISRDPGGFGYYVGQFSGGSYGLHADGTFYYNGTYTPSYSLPFTSGDVIGVAFDADAGTLTFYKNGVSGGQATSSATGGGFFPAVSTVSSGQSASLNFGQRPWAYPGSVPAGFKALCDQNLPTPAVIKSNTQMDAVYWLGDNASNRKIPINFAPGLFWAKARSGNPYHSVNDAVRGPNAILQTNTTTQEQVNSNGYVTAFLSDGVTVTNGSDINAAGSNYIGWVWNAGAGNPAQLNAGSIQTTCKANQAAGFSIITYSGVNSPSTNTIAHGLNAKPSAWLIKNRTSNTGNWVLTFVSPVDGNIYYSFLNGTNAGAAQGSPWSTQPTASVITLGANDDNTCAAGNNYVGYVFAPVQGFSAFGSFTSTNSSQLFVHLGFKPKWIMMKQVGGSVNSNDGWYIYDTTRGTNNFLLASAPYFENRAQNNTATITYATEVYSNGFGFAAGQDHECNNNAGGTVIYLAFAESPFKYARASAAYG